MCTYILRSVQPARGNKKRRWETDEKDSEEERKGEMTASENVIGARPTSTTLIHNSFPLLMFT